MTPLKGVAHVHSTYSYDGCPSLAEIVAFLNGRGLDFVLMSEHTRGLTERDALRAPAAAYRLARRLLR